MIETITEAKNFKAGDILIGDNGGRSEITGSTEESSVIFGALAIETEHGTLYLDPEETFTIIAYGDRNNWDDNYIQFPRLLDECSAVLITQQYRTIADSMDLPMSMVHGLFDRARSVWDEIKERT